MWSLPSLLPPSLHRAAGPEAGATEAPEAGSLPGQEAGRRPPLNWWRDTPGDTQEGTDTHLRTHRVVQTHTWEHTEG